jgi:hypothetical protein
MDKRLSNSVSSLQTECVDKNCTGLKGTVPRDFSPPVFSSTAPPGPDRQD